ncbi:hypothetical protein [Alkalitalea saponilacus]|uniref:hypothetical protein n=1 Tax=Alkalitalea saponilacus TaxID=889453 RepID=UPI001178C951|nr:hypothetical protein [Alkalitalea saponilacus]
MKFADAQVSLSFTAEMGKYIDRAFVVTVMPRSIQNNVFLNYLYNPQNEFLESGLGRLAGQSVNNNHFQIFGMSR